MSLRKSVPNFQRLTKHLQFSAFYADTSLQVQPRQTPSSHAQTMAPSHYSRHLVLQDDSDERSNASQGLHSPVENQIKPEKGVKAGADDAAGLQTKNRYSRRSNLAKTKPLHTYSRTHGISSSAPVLPSVNTELEQASESSSGSLCSFSSKYSMGSMLDFGSYAKVSCCTRKSDGALFAVKEAHVFGPYKEQLLHSCAILRKVDHTLLSKVVDYIYDSTEEKVYVISNLYRYGSIYSKLKAERRNYATSFPDERVVWDVASQIVDALDFLHNPEHNQVGVIVHRDISLKNVLVSDVRTKRVITILSILAVELVGGAKTVQLVGCVTYAAPEVLRGSEYDEKADIWSLGCAIYEICKGYQLFYSTDIPKLIKVQQEEPAINISMYSKELEEFVKSMIKLNPDDRITAREAAKHPKIVEARKRLEDGSSAGYGWFNE